MKKLLLLFLLAGIIGSTAFAQKKSGTIYAEHEYIDMTKEFWKAFVENDQEKFLSFLADSVYNYDNDLMTHRSKESYKGVLNFWSQFDHLKIEDNATATPDALEYIGGITWVMDWLKVTGIHSPSGIIVDMPVHMMYRFNDEGKIFVLMWNYNNNQLESIINSSTITENGKVYDNHPYITIVRKMMNAYAEMDVEKWASFYAPNVTFWNSRDKWGEFIGLEERKQKIKDSYEIRKSFRFVQIGYPDLIHYEKGDTYQVYSWWNMFVENKDGTGFELPFMSIIEINKDGKITRESGYYSSNHFE